MKHAPGFLALVNEVKTRVRELGFREVKQRLDAGEKFTVVDVREDNEWAKGHLPGAVHLGKGIIERDIEQVIPDKVGEHRALLWRGISFGAGSRQPAKDGLHRLHLDGRRMARVDRSRLSDGNAEIKYLRAGLRPLLKMFMV